jgi:hypothetical protein
MNLNSAALKLMAAKGLTLDDVAEIVAANEQTRDPTATERQRRCRANKKPVSHGVTVTRDTPPNERDNLTPREVSEPSGSSPQPWALPVGVSLQVWTDFLTNRKRKRLPNTPTAWKSFNDDLSRLAIETGIPPPKLIELCTAKGWGAIYDPREQRHDQRSISGTRSSDGLSATTRAARDVFGLGAGHR